MTTIMIPNKNTKAKKEKVAVIPPKKYKEFTPTAAQKLALKRAREAYKRGEYITLEQLEHEMGFKDKSKR